jgi:hypothetical protein
MTYERFVVGDFIVSPKVYNEFSPGNSETGGSYSVRGAVELPALGKHWMLEGSYRSYSYPHSSGITAAQFASAFDGNPCPHGGLPVTLTPAAGDQGCVTLVGAYGQVAVPSFSARDTDFDARVGLKIAEPRIYAGVGYLHREKSYGYPKQNGFGLGAEKLPDLGRRMSVYGSIWYYPNVSGGFTYAPGAPRALVGTNDKLQQSVLAYRIGGTLNLGKSRIFLDAGILGDSIRGTNLAPSGASHAGGYTGLGIKL